MSKVRSEFKLNDYTLREFETFLIILAHEGNELRELKKEVDKSFQHKSRTKGYDYINDICKKGLAYKKSIYENGKKQTKVFVNDEARKIYEKFIIPTISDTKKAAIDFFKDKLRELNDLELVRKRFINYTEGLIEEIKELIENTSASAIKKKRFLKTVENRIWTHSKGEILQYEYGLIKENK